MINVYMDDLRTPTIEGEKLAPPDPYWVITRTIDDTKTLLSAQLINDLSLDHDMGFENGIETGYDLTKWMEQFNIWPSGRITLHTGNMVGRENMLAVLKRNGK